jgi:hypothetical protein
MQYADNEAETAYPSNQTIASKVGMSVRNVQAALARLRHLGLVTEVDGKGGRGRTALRKVVFPKRMVPNVTLSDPAKDDSAKRKKMTQFKGRMTPPLRKARCAPSPRTPQ